MNLQFLDVESHAGFLKAAQKRGGVGFADRFNRELDVGEVGVGDVGNGFGEFQDVVVGEVLGKHGWADDVGGERGPGSVVFRGIGLAEADGPVQAGGGDAQGRVLEGEPGGGGVSECGLAKDRRTGGKQGRELHRDEFPSGVPVHRVEVIKNPLQADVSASDTGLGRPTVN